jgi:hypothetical protein
MIWYTAACNIIEMIGMRIYVPYVFGGDAYMLSILSLIFEANDFITNELNRADKNVAEW